MLDEVDKQFPDLREKICGALVVKVNPNVVSFLALLAAIAAGYFFWQNLLWLAGILVFVNGFLDILDGAIAKKYGTSKFGDFLDHTFDRLADIAILVGIAFN
ncbi:CDP-alcohol phosphatidyltransferase family protein, partial [Candidatus Woesearchaeota archaeon]|nr:CDP-alcohol phosphatidyltransferase family protein [Candidatus Woesearchaeota archaeon]